MKPMTIALGLAGLGLAYVFLTPKDRFLGDKLKVGDDATVDVAKLKDGLASAPEALTLLTAIGGVAIVVRVSRVAADTFEGPITGIVLGDGTVRPLGTLGGARTFPKSAVVRIAQNEVPRVTP